VVVPDADAAHRRAVDAGADVSGDPVEQDYGSRDFSVIDPEGNVWALGTHPGRSGGGLSGRLEHDKWRPHYARGTPWTPSTSS